MRKTHLVNFRLYENELLKLNEIAAYYEVTKTAVLRMVLNREYERTVAAEVYREPAKKRKVR